MEAALEAARRAAAAIAGATGGGGGGGGGVPVGAAAAPTSTASSTFDVSRCLFVSNLPPSIVTPQHLLQLMSISLVSSGLATQTNIPITSCVTNPSKRCGLVEFRAAEQAGRAVALNGAMCMGVPVAIRAATAEDQATVKDGAGGQGMGMGMGVGMGAGAGAGAGGGAGSTDIRSAGGLVLGSSRMHVSGFPEDMTQDQVRDMVSKIGPLSSWEWATNSDGKPAGSATFEFVHTDLIEKAVQSLHGMPLGDGKATLSVRRLDEVQAEQRATAANGGVEVEKAKPALVSAPLNPNPAVEENIAKTMTAATTILARAVQANGGQVIAQMTPFLKLMNLVTFADLKDPFERDDIMDDIREECSMHGTVVDLAITKPFVPPMPSVPEEEENPRKLARAMEKHARKEREAHADVYVQFDTAESARTALLALAGRTFNARAISGTFVTREDMLGATADDPE